MIIIQTTHIIDDLTHKLVDAIHTLDRARGESPFIQGMALREVERAVDRRNLHIESMNWADLN